MEFSIGQIFTSEYPPEAAVWCNKNNAYIVRVDNKYEIKEIPGPSPEEIEKMELAKAKQERAEAVSKITVEIDGMVFDGDEVSQERMSRTVVAAAATGETGDATTTWVLHDNTIAQPTISQLARALRAAGEAQTKLWTMPYEDTVEDPTENTEAVAV